MNTDVVWPSFDEAELRVLRMQAKLQQWATDSPDRRFDDLFNLVTDPCFYRLSARPLRSHKNRRNELRGGRSDNGTPFLTWGSIVPGALVGGV